MGNNNAGSITTPTVDLELPLEGATRGKLVVYSGAPRIALDGGAATAHLLRARFERPLPDVRLQDGEVQIRYPSYSLLNWLIYWRQPLAQITLNASLLWWIEVHGGVSRFDADLRHVQLTGIDLHGGVSHMRVALSQPAGTVSIRVIGGVSDMAIQRPADVPVRVRVRGGVSSLTFDEQHFGAMADVPQLESPGFGVAVNRYDIQISGGVSHLRIDTQSLLALGH